MKLLFANFAFPFFLINIKNVNVFKLETKKKKRKAKIEAVKNRETKVDGSNRYGREKSEKGRLQKPNEIYHFGDTELSSSPFRFTPPLSHPLSTAFNSTEIIL